VLSSRRSLKGNRPRNYAGWAKSKPKLS